MLSNVIINPCSGLVTYVAYAAEDNALGKAARALWVASAQLPQYGQQSIADQGVNLVDHQYQRLPYEFDSCNHSAASMMAPGVIV